MKLHGNPQNSFMLGETKMIRPEVRTYGENGLQHEYMKSKRNPLPFVSDRWREKMNKNELDIISRIDRILSASNERGLDETEVRTFRDAKREILELRKELGHSKMDEMARLNQEMGLY